MSENPLSECAGWFDILDFFGPHIPWPPISSDSAAPLKLFPISGGGGRKTHVFLPSPNAFKPN
jgi:hypothetical protein